MSSVVVEEVGGGALSAPHVVSWLITCPLLSAERVTEQCKRYIVNVTTTLFLRSYVINFFLLMSHDELAYGHVLSHNGPVHGVRNTP